MLPAPVTLDRSQRQFAKLGLRRASLLDPVRFTNLAVLRLSVVACASVLLNLNLRLYFSTPAVRYATASVPEPRNTALTALRLIALDATLPDAAVEDGVVQHITRPAHARNLTHLVIVHGHAIWKGTEPQMRMSEEEWELASY